MPEHPIFNILAQLFNGKWMLFIIQVAQLTKDCHLS